MISGVQIKTISKYEDARGWLAEIWRQDEINYEPAMGYVSLTGPGIARGPHEHKNQSDFFFFVGPGDFALYLWDNRKSSPTSGERAKIEVGEKNPTAVLVPPGVVHGYKCISKTPAVSINFPDRLYRGEQKSEEIDEIRWESDPKSPFKID